MLTERNFIEATAYENHFAAASLPADELADYGICSVSDVVSTQDTITDFRRAHGEGRSIETPFGPLHYWTGVQMRKGRARGTMYALDAGDRRLSFFTGEA